MYVCICVYEWYLTFPGQLYNTTADIAKRDWAPYIYVHVIQPQHCNT